PLDAFYDVRECFFIYCIVVHRDLHSFPTRRSSDLDTIVGGNRERCLRSGFTSPPRITPASFVSYATKPRWALDYLFREKFSLPRSEEHTSELQSRENLVCRLLLEKKN